MVVGSINTSGDHNVVTVDCIDTFGVIFVLCLIEGSGSVSGSLDTFRVI